MRAKMIACLCIVLFVLGTVAFATIRNHSALSPSGKPPALKSGIAGTVLLGPTCPVERIPPDPRCADKPLQTNLEATTPDGNIVVQTFSSDANGIFSVALRPGDYIIQPSQQTSIYPRCISSGVVHVVANTYTQITIRCDTGIR